MAELLSCEHCGSNVSSQAARRIGNKLVCPRCVRAAEQAMEAEKQQASIAKEREKLQARMAKGQEQKERPAQEGAAERIDVVPVPDEQDDPAEDDPTQSGLYTCPDCGREISQLASSCPGCGRPSTVKEAQKIVLFVLLLILLLVFGGCVFKVVLTLA